MNLNEIVDAIEEYGYGHYVDFRVCCAEDGTLISTAGNNFEDISINSISIHLDNYFKSLNSYIQGATFKGIDCGWREINREKAHFILSSILEFDLVHHMCEMEHQLAKTIADSFLNLFASDARYFTNGNFSVDGRLTSWTSATNWMFDTGVVVCDCTHIGMIWAEDED